MAQLARTSFRERIEPLEDEWLSPLATRSYPAVREEPEPDSDHRTPFQRDRDRIVHSKPFRRLKHKTQVFISPEGDHYRTRLTHTLEACGIARGVARALGLNEDLTEAISLGHDLGHPPFGHTGEEVLDACVRERGGSGFRHNEHSLRVVDVLERLNLTAPVRDGILRHTGDEPPETLEGRIVRLVDRVAYINHDIDDAIRAGVLALRGPAARRDRAARLDRVGADRDAGGGPAAALRGRRRTSSRARRWAARCCACARSCSSASTSASARRPSGRASSGCCARCSTTTWQQLGDEQAVIDWLAGMTDRYAIREFENLSVPQGF